MLIWHHAVNGFFCKNRGFFPFAAKVRERVSNEAKTDVCLIRLKSMFLCGRLANPRWQGGEKGFQVEEFMLRDKKAGALAPALSIKVPIFIR
ncbi:hypothetical protein NF212_04780 [Parasalinivibrio latis]|uniref:hypothetical protein n=1 Tax=Parasalinivibrio latis TaxID=2952610 RepID=UPI0030E32EDC